MIEMKTWDGAIILETELEPFLLYGGAIAQVEHFYPKASNPLKISPVIRRKRFRCLEA